MEAFINRRKSENTKFTPNAVLRKNAYSDCAVCSGTVMIDRHPQSHFNARPDELKALKSEHATQQIDDKPTFGINCTHNRICHAIEQSKL